MSIHLGYEIGSGRAISIPAGHLCVTGQSQKSGKTTTLEALITRSKKKAVAFVTKRGEGSFKVAHPVLPYFDDDLSKREDGWLFVQRLLEAALEQKLKDTTPYVIEAVAGAKNLLDVADKVTAMLSKGAAAEASGKRFNKADRRAWMCLQAYFSVIMPELRRLPRSNKFALHAGLNVMDLGEYSPQTQMMVVASVLNHVSQKESNVISVIPEAWEFVPQVGTSPVSAVAEELARKGAALGNFVWFDSQDIAGVDKMLFRNVSVWLFGVQRETNELERTLKSIPNLGRRPRLEDLTTLKKGEFIVCFDANIHKVYVQPAWMGETHAQAIATGDMDVASAREVEKTWDREHKKDPRESDLVIHVNHGPRPEDEIAAPNPSVELELVRASLADANSEIERLRGNIAVMKSEIGYLRETQAGPINKQFASEAKSGGEPSPTLDSPLDALLPDNASNTAPKTFARLNGDRAARDNGDVAEIPDSVKLKLLGWLIDRAKLDPGVLEVIAKRPELRVTIKRETVLAESGTTRGLLALMLKDGFFAEPRNRHNAHKELQRRGSHISDRSTGRECDALAEMGFLTKESAGYLAVPGMKMFIEETKSDGGNTKCQK